MSMALFFYKFLTPCRSLASPSADIETPCASGAPVSPRNSRFQPESAGYNLALEFGIGSSKRRWDSLRALWVETPVMVRLHSAA